ncbi:hypothetical protein HDU76_000498 [Blyttiomyces sp. JEL0837]|nr:hypothetical protein HDU76_000498 [Blyttiomyces sp. JEL0837]
MGFSKPRAPSKKGPAKKVDTSKYDLPPSLIATTSEKMKKGQVAIVKPAKSTKLENEPLPRAFKMLMAKAKAVAPELKFGGAGKEEKVDSVGKGRGDGGRTKGAKGEDNGPAKGKKADDRSKEQASLKRLPGESLKDFSRRLDDDIRKSVNAAARSETKTSIKRKARLAERKKKREIQRKKGKLPGPDGTLQTPGASQGTFTTAGEKTFEKVPFGFQAQEPPKFTVVPRKIGGHGKAMLQALMKKNARSEENEEEDDAEAPNAKRAKTEPQRPAEPTVGRKTKLKNLPLVQQKVLAEQRQLAIEAYRKKKELAKK